MAVVCSGGSEPMTTASAAVRDGRHLQAAYGGVRALEGSAISKVARRTHPRRARRKRRGEIDPHQDHGRRGRSRMRGACCSREARCAFGTPVAANAAGIVCVFQELSLIPDLCVADNIVISRSAPAFRHDRPRAAQRQIAEEALARAGAADIHPLGPGGGSAAVAPADGGDRQGAGPQAAHPHPRRGDLGADGESMSPRSLRC